MIYFVKGIYFKMSQHFVKGQLMERCGFSSSNVNVTRRFYATEVINLGWNSDLPNLVMIEIFPLFNGKPPKILNLISYRPSLSMISRVISSAVVRYTESVQSVSVIP